MKEVTFALANHMSKPFWLRSLPKSEMLRIEPSEDVTIEMSGAIPTIEMHVEDWHDTLDSYLFSISPSAGRFSVLGKDLASSQYTPGLPMELGSMFRLVNDLPIPLVLVMEPSAEERYLDPLMDVDVYLAGSNPTVCFTVADVLPVGGKPLRDSMPNFYGLLGPEDMERAERWHESIRANDRGGLPISFWSSGGTYMVMHRDELIWRDPDYPDQDNTEE